MDGLFDLDSASSPPFGRGPVPADFKTIFLGARID